MDLKAWVYNVQCGNKQTSIIESIGERKRAGFGMADVIAEFIASIELVDIHRDQVYNYLKSTGYRLGPLVNFGNHPKLKWERIVR